MAGMVWRKSSTGRMTEEALADFAAQIPTGIAMISASTLATSTSDSVDIALPHWSTK